MKSILIFSMVILTQCALLDTSQFSRYDRVSATATEIGPVHAKQHQPHVNSRYSLEKSFEAPIPFEKQMIHKSDIYLGMNEYSVRASWGQPEQVESAGNGNSKFQRWVYKKMVPTATGYLKEERLVFFEEGKVVGWETR